MYDEPLSSFSGCILNVNITSVNCTMSRWGHSVTVFGTLTL